MKIFISGIAGLLGSNVGKTLQKLGHTVVGVDNLIGGYESNIPYNIDYFHLDVRNTETLSQIMTGSDIVIHCSALAYEGLSVFSPALVCDNLYSSTVSMATAAIRNKVKKFINCSSMARYGNQTPPFTENMLCKPEDPYGLAKVQAEQVLNMLADIHGLHVIHCVPHNIIGVGQKYDDPFRNVMSILLNKALQKQNVIIYGDGTQKRSISYIQDCIFPMINLIYGNFANKEIFNIGPDGNELTINELADIAIDVAAQYTQVRVDKTYFPSRPREVKNAWCSSDKARKYLDFEPKTNIRDGLEEMADWIWKRGILPFDYRLPIQIITEQTPKTWVNQLF